MNATAIDPGTVKGKLTHKGKDYPLKHVYAWQPHAQAEELWVYVTDAEVPAAAAKDLVKPAELARENRFRGVKLVIHPTKPDLNSLQAVPYAPGESGMLTASGTSPKWQRLVVGDKRVAGNGDNALLTTRVGPNVVETMRLFKTRDGWKIAE
jgi:hypothetical protein